MSFTMFPLMFCILYRGLFVRFCFVLIFYIAIEFLNVRNVHIRMLYFWRENLCFILILFTVIKTNVNDGGEDVWSQLNVESFDGQINFIKMKKKNQEQNPYWSIKDLGGLSSEEMKSGYHHFYSRSVLSKSIPYYNLSSYSILRQIKLWYTKLIIL